MLDVRPVAYVVPVAEQEFASLTPVIQIANYGTVDALVTGHIYIYRDSTGLKLYTSELVITTILANTVVNVSALSPWSPPAPADDDYFVMCDITAVAVQPHEPPSIVTQLGPYTFDIKPVGMGPAPAAHGVTHEDGGSDELDVTGLSGLLADQQDPLPHHATHELGGSDELDVTGLPGAGGAGGAAFSFVTDCLNASVTSSAPWSLATISNGTLTDVVPTAEHPGVLQFSSSTTPNSGYRIHLAQLAFILGGTEKCDIILKPKTLADTTIRAGFHDSTTSGAPVDGCYFHLNPATAKITGRTMDNSAASTTGTDFQAVTNTWYHLVVELNADATRVDFTIYDEAGAVLWTDNLTTNIPTGASRACQCTVVATNSNSSAVALLELDLVSVQISRTLAR